VRFTIAVVVLAILVRDLQRRVRDLLRGRFGFGFR